MVLPAGSYARSSHESRLTSATPRVRPGIKLAFCATRTLCEREVRAVNVSLWLVVSGSTDPLKT